MNEEHEILAAQLRASIAAAQARRAQIQAELGALMAQIEDLAEREEVYQAALKSLEAA